MQQKIILAFVGPLGSGKGTACQYLKDKYGANSYRFSTILRDLLSRLYLEHSRTNLQKISTVLRQNFSEDIMAKVMAKDVGKDAGKIVAVDGVRRMADIIHLQKIAGFNLIDINADEKIRYERLIKRSENTDDQSKTFEQFQADNRQESELQIKDVQSHANFKIDNSGTPADLYEQIDIILSKSNANLGR